MLITNIIQDSFQEYEDHHSLVLFSHGCNLKCKRCYNLKEILDKNNILGTAEKIINKNLTPLHDAIVFLGGEPTIWGDKLINTIKFVKDKNLKVKIFSNGLKPKLIEKINNLNLVDAYSIDFKVIDNIEILNTYLKLEEYLQLVNESINNICLNNVPLEIRTTKWKEVNIEKLKQYVFQKWPDIKHILTNDFLI